MSAPTISQVKLEFKYVAGSAADPDGNTIPDSGQSFTGEYSFSTQDSMNDFISRASIMEFK